MMRSICVDEKVEGETGHYRLSCALSKIGGFVGIGRIYVFLLEADERLLV